MKIETSHGFTTIELITVMIISAVIGVVAVVKFTSSSNVAVGGAAKVIQADIRYTQELAMAGYEAKTITFAAGTSSYSVDSETQELPSGITISNNFTVTFNSLGEPIAGGGGSVSISGAGNSNSITVSDYTGNAVSYTHLTLPTTPYV